MKKLMSIILSFIFLTSPAFAGLEISDVPASTKINPQAYYHQLDLLQTELQKTKNLIDLLKSTDGKSASLDPAIDRYREHVIAGSIASGVFAVVWFRSLAKKNIAYPFAFIGTAFSLAYATGNFHLMNEAELKAETIAAFEKMTPQELTTFRENVNKQIEAIKQAKLNIEGAFQ